MKKILYSILTLVVLSGVIISCSGDSYQKRIDKEKKAIKNYLADNGISVTTVYPKDHVFPKNTYYLEEGTGIYMRVIDPGDLSNKPDSGELQPITIRTDSVLKMVSGGYLYGNDAPVSENISFVYGNSSTYKNSSGTYSYYFMSPALVLPIEKGVGYGAEVSLIVPFMNGSSFQTYNYEPLYFSKIIYRFQKQVGEDKKDTDKQ